MQKITPALLLAAALVAPPALAAKTEAAIVENSLKVLTEMQAMPDLQVPDWLLQRAEGIAVLPDVIKAGAFVGGRGGSGVLLVRHPDRSWSNPLFIGLGAGSVGWQFGVQAADVVLVFTTRRSVEGITDGKITLGADASAVAGPVGRTASAATSVTLDAEVYSYSRAKGLFAGVSLEGGVLFIRDRANERFYGRRNMSPSEIISEQAPAAPAPGPSLVQEVTRMTMATAAQATEAGPPAVAAEAPPATDRPAAQTFPMADPKPGAEPN
jgi:lipid-binding SYLF domain-containing protein